MKQSLQQKEYTLFSIEFDKSETTFQSVDEIIDYLKDKIDTHNTARYIAIYDHYSHTTSLPEGQVSKDIIAAKHIVFCFGITLPDPLMMAVRPRSIGVIEHPSSFFVTFLEAPMPVANVTMEEWVKGICNRQSTS